MELQISVGAPGSVRVGGGATGCFVGGTIEFGGEARTPRVEQRGRRVRIGQAERPEEKFDFSFDAVNRWDLKPRVCGQFGLPLTASFSPEYRSPATERAPCPFSSRVPLKGSPGVSNSYSGYSGI